MSGPGPAEVGFVGLAPTMTIERVKPRPITEHERKKYADIWGFPAYSEESPGERMVDLFMAIAKPEAGQTVLDIGAGSGRASLALRAKQLDVTAFDLTTEGWTQKDIPIRTGTVWRDLPGAAFYDFTYCCDVMEHIPTELTALTIDKILSTTDHAFFSVCFLPDSFGSYIGEPLHLTVKPFTWWKNLFMEVGCLEEARDLIDDGVFFVSR